MYIIHVCNIIKRCSGVVLLVYMKQILERLWVENDEQRTLNKEHLQAQTHNAATVRHVKQDTVKVAEASLFVVII